MKRTLNTLRARHLVAGTALVALVAMVGCRGKDDSSDSSDDDEAAGGVAGGTGGGATNDGVVDADTPADSTGTPSPVSLSFDTAGGAAALALQGGGTVDLGGGLILTDARINIGSIKIKANKEMGDEEREVKKALEAEKEAIEASLEDDKKALEQQKEELKATYEPQFEAAASDAEEDALKDQMKADEAAIEEQMAALEAVGDAKMADLEAQKDGNLKWKGPYVYDLVNGGVTPAIPDVELTDGSYRRIEFKVKPNRDLDGSDPLLNNSVYVAGTVDVGGVATPFTVSLRVDEEFKLMGAGAFKVDPSVANSLTVMFDPATWFAGVDFSAATADMTGTLVVDDVNNQSLFEVVRKNLKSSTKFGEDEDGDGELEEAESEGDGDEGVAEEEAAESEAQAAE